MPLDRTWYNTLVDDDGSNSVGTVWNKAAVDALMDAIDASLATVGGGSMTLLKSGSGTTTNAAAENVDTVAISGLTAADTLHVELTMESVTQLTTNPLLYNNTDAVTIVSLLGGANLGAGGSRQCFCTTRQAQSGATIVKSLSVQFETTVAAGNATFTTAWTGAWTLALRHGGVTAGGTFKWSWSVFKIAGQ